MCRAALPPPPCCARSRSPGGRTAGRTGRPSRPTPTLAERRQRQRCGRPGWCGTSPGSRTIEFPSPPGRIASWPGVRLSAASCTTSRIRPKASARRSATTTAISSLRWAPGHGAAGMVRRRPGTAAADVQEGWTLACPRGRLVKAGNRAMAGPHAAGPGPAASDDRHCGNADGGFVPVAAILRLGERIRAERARQGLSLRGLARAVGLSPSLISQIETGRCQPSVSTLYAITTALGVSVEEVFGDGDAVACPRPGPALARRTGTAGPVGPVGPDARPARPAGLEARGPVFRHGARDVLELQGGVTWERLGHVPGTSADFLLVTYPPGSSSSPDGQ